MQDAARREPPRRSRAPPDLAGARRRLRLQARARRARRDPRRDAGRRAVRRPAGRNRDQRRRGGLAAERPAGAGCDHRLLHAGGRRPVRLRAHRRDQRALRRLCDGRRADPGAGDRRHACRPPAGRHDPRHPRRRRRGLRRGWNSGGGRPLHRQRRADLWAGGAGPRPPGQGDDQSRRSGRATC